MHPFSMELTAAHRKFEFERAVKTAQTEGRIRREAEEAKRRIAATGQSAAPGDLGVSHSLFALLRRLVPTRLSRTMAATRL
jgi:hypothetical protein